MMTYSNAVEVLKERGWCCAAQHPYSTFKMYICGPRGVGDEYGPFPDGWVMSTYGCGDTFVEAVENALRNQARKAASTAA